MHFKSLPKPVQSFITAQWVEFVNTKSDTFPIVSPIIWLKAFRQLNVSIGPTLLPTPSGLEQIIDLVHEWLHSSVPIHGTCSCCGETW